MSELSRLTGGDLRCYVVDDAGDGHPSIVVRSDAEYITALEAEVERLREQVGWTVSRCNSAMGDGFSGTPNSSVAAVCDEVKRLRRAIERHRGLRGKFAVWKGDRELWRVLDA